jgi:phosphoribosylamine--glycine ligase
MLEKQFGEAGDEVIIEERLTGSEVSVLAFCDGTTAKVMPPAQDHKRIFNRDQGPNTGGMGAYAPAPICPPELLHQIEDRVLQPALAGLQQEGCPYVGVLYAGIILTARGPRVLEFNCRFGDPEAQVLLPLLKTDLLEIVEQSLTGHLADLTIEWETGAAATVVLASQGYPGAYEKGKPITGLAEAAQQEGVILFHAATRLAEDGQLITDGGRVLSVTGIAPGLSEALERAYAGVHHIQFEGKHYRTDIGWGALT